MRLLIRLAGILAGGVLLAAGGFHWWLAPRIQDYLAKWGSAFLGRTIHMDHVRFQLVPLAVTLRNLTVESLSPDSHPVLQAQHLVLHVHPRALLQGQVLIHEIRMEEFHGLLHRFANGTDNLFSPKAPMKERPLRQTTAPMAWQWHIERVFLSHGTITVRDDATGYNATLHQLQAQLGPITPTAAVPIDLATAWEMADAHGTVQIQQAQLSIHPIHWKAPRLEATAISPMFHFPRIQGALDITVSPQRAASVPAWGWIRALEGSFSGTLQDAVLAGLKAPHIQVQGETQHGLVTITQGTAQVAQGQISLHASLDGRDDILKARGALKVQDIHTAQLLTSLGHEAPVRGRLAMNVQWSGQGASPNAILNTLVGQAQILLENATIPNLPLRESLGTLAPLLVSPTLPQRVDVAVHQALAQGPIHHGVFRATVSGHGPWFTLRGTADFHLAPNHLNGSFQITPTAQAAQDIGPVAALVQGIPIPVQVQGPVHNLAIQVDANHLLRQHGPTPRPGKPPAQIPEILQRFLRP